MSKNKDNTAMDIKALIKYTEDDLKKRLQKERRDDIIQFVVGTFAGAITAVFIVLVLNHYY